MSPEEENNFTFVDKRRTAADPPAAPAPTAEPEPVSEPEPPSPNLTLDEAEPVEADEEADEELADHPRLQAMDRVLMSIDILYQGAWIAMGLVADPVTKEIERDLAEARVLVDSVIALVEVLGPKVDERIGRELRNLVANLQMNFINQTNRA